MEPTVFRAVLGRRLVRTPEEADNIESFHPRVAVLGEYKKVSPDRSYYYAVPDPHGRIRGYVVGPLPGECMSALLKFEGKNYSRRRVKVQTKDGLEKALVFIGNLKAMSHSFGYEFNDSFKQEILLQHKIDQALSDTDEEKDMHTQVNRRAAGELRGRTIRDIIKRHFDAGGISDYAIRNSIRENPLRDFSAVMDDPVARKLAPNYLSMVLRQVIFNEVEEHIRNDFRYEIDHMGLRTQYYERTVSSLIALRLLNAKESLMDMIVGDCLTDLSFEEDHLVDFIRWGVAAADAVYDAREGKRQLDYIRSHMGRGYTPMGAELEFSNVGQGVIRDPDGKTFHDNQYDGFYYFRDFGLDELTWKLGGHIDDHRNKSSDKPRRGFFEIALGNLSIEAGLSKPVTDDPWLLNQFIHEARRFYPIRPHSVHISLQLRNQYKPVRDRCLPLGVLKCLFAVAGDPAKDEQGKIRITRLANDEIINEALPKSMFFSEISRRHAQRTDDQERIHADHRRGRFVQQFKFLRLSSYINYEPIAMALKGIQLKMLPGSFLTPYQYRTSEKHRLCFEELSEWGKNPLPISSEDQELFFSNVYKGLMGEKRGKPAHSEAYIAWSINQIRHSLSEFNRALTRKVNSQAN